MDFDMTKVFEKMYNTKTNEELKKELIELSLEGLKLIGDIKDLLLAYFTGLMLMDEEEIERMFKTIFGERKEEDNTENELKEAIEHLQKLVDKQKEIFELNEKND